MRRREPGLDRAQGLAEMEKSAMRKGVPRSPLQVIEKGGKRGGQGESLGKKKRARQDGEQAKWDAAWSGTRQKEGNRSTGTEKKEKGGKKQQR